MPRSLSMLFELRRRRVFRGIGFYLVGAWTLLQVAEVIAEPAGLPDWTLTALLYLAVVGFPLAVWLAWRYELTEDGLVRTGAATAADSGADLSLKTSDYLILAAMVTIIAVISWQGLSSIRSESEQNEAKAEAEREAHENSVAVLPFSDLSAAGDQAFLGEGIADTVLHVLSQVDGLSVSARTSSFAFTGRQLTIPEIAGELNVAHILEGSVQRDDDQLMIIARLNDANGIEVWSGRFQRPPEQIFKTQEEIALEVVVALKGAVLEDDRERLVDEYQPDLRAYEQYVIGRRELDQGTAQSIESAVRRFERAIEIDPGYALAYVGLARAHNARHRTQPGLSRPDTLEKIDELVDKALDRDPTLAEAWNLRSALQAERKQFDEAIRSLETALELNPNSADIWAGYWNYQMIIGDQEEALAAIRRAVELDPESSNYQSKLAEQLFRLSRAEEAIYVLRENLRRHPESPHAYTQLARYLNQVGRPGEAMWYLKAIQRRDPENLSLLQGVCLQHWQLWDMRAAIDCQQQYVDANPDNLDGRKWLAVMHEDYEKAIELGEQEVEQLPAAWYPKLQLAEYLAQDGQWRRIVDLVGAAFPMLLAPDPPINDFTQWPARRLAEALMRTGETEQANLLIDRTLDFLERSRKLQAGGWMSGTEDAMLYAIRGEDDRAIETLRRAVVRDWMFYARSVVFDSAFVHLQDNPDFIAVITLLEENLARQRNWYEQHKDALQL